MSAQPPAREIALLPVPRQATYADGDLRLITMRNDYA